MDYDVIVGITDFDSDDVGSIPTISAKNIFRNILTFNFIYIIIKCQDQL